MTFHSQWPSISEVAKPICILCRLQKILCLGSLRPQNLMNLFTFSKQGGGGQFYTQCIFGSIFRKKMPDESLFWKSQKFIPFCGRGLPLYINYKHNIWSRLSRCTDINVNGKHPTQTCTHVKLPLSFPSCCVLTRLHKNPNCRAFGICGRH